MSNVMKRAPPCKRCETRGEACDYAGVPARLQRPVHETPEGRITEAIPDGHTTCLSFPTNNRHLDLQLMHRWTTSTYKSCCTPGTGDETLWQLTVPALAFQYDFLLNGLLALSAFDSASILKNDGQQNSNYDKYINSAIEYQVLALANFRAQLDSPCEDQRAATFFSLMLMVLTFAAVRFGQNSCAREESIVNTAIAHFELVRGAVQVAGSDGKQISQNEYVQKLTPFEALPFAALDPSTAEIMAKLMELNDRRIVEAVREIQERQAQQIAFWEACKKALHLLQECFQKCVGPVYRGYALGWLNMAGEGYIQALKMKDHISLLILMAWGILVERLGQDVWWAQEFGVSLVDELSNEDLSTATDPLTRNTILRIQELISPIVHGREKK
ncbi:Zn2/Cys6 DNA-binding protein [Penicillium longicatenatum]|uniref:Zn2/Cys6 DNA-binding protein n=1 Tax=Penicillium longicatenatum TaxID=1561947 RepID=UPI0025491CB6|nr:Zn2/Cys6 DNA-binding protein [Penicillium longicatenatum]KAJ5631087.1 Zn2/Cys6 DNA-binding protein [Penicillium longicatenatum]